MRRERADMGARLCLGKGRRNWIISIGKLLNYRNVRRSSILHTAINQTSL